MKFLIGTVRRIANHNVMEAAYKRFNDQRALDAIQSGELTLQERMRGQENCPECGKDEWLILPLIPCIKEGGKSYIQCTHCGLLTHL